MGDTNDADDTIEIPILGEQVLSENDTILAEGEKLLDEIKSSKTGSEARVAWLESLSDADRKIIDVCEERGISVTRANFDEVAAIVRAHFPEY